MNSQLKEINQIIILCDEMVNEVQNKGILRVGNKTYEAYKKKINAFMSSQNLKQCDYGPYAVLDALFFSKGNYTVNLSEAQTIRNLVVELKHSLFPQSFDKIFISHREKDKEQVAAFIELLHAIGIPRPTIDSDEKMIFCTSHPATYVDNGARNLEEIRNQFNSSDHTFYILWYTDNYFESQACLNEAGAIWATKKTYQEILAPQFDSSKIGGLMDKEKTWFRANDNYRLNNFKQDMESMFDLKPLTLNAWEDVKNVYVERIESLVGK